MQGYVLAVSIIAGASVLAVLAYLAFRIFKKTAERKTDAETTGLCPPRIVLTSDSPGQSKKRLYSPARERAASKDKEEKLAKIKKKEKRREIKSLWLPKKKTSLPMMQATMVQPAVPEQTKVCKIFFYPQGTRLHARFFLAPSRGRGWKLVANLHGSRTWAISWLLYVTDNFVPNPLFLKSEGLCFHAIVRQVAGGMTCVTLSFTTNLTTRLWTAR